MNEPVKIRVFIRTNSINSEYSEVVEFDRDEWDSMNDDSREEACRDVVFNMSEWGWSEE